MLTRRQRPTVRWAIEHPGSHPGGYAVTPDGRSLIMSDSGGVAWPSMKVRRFDLSDGSLCAERRLGDHVRGVAFDAGGARMLATFDKRLRLIDVEALEELDRWEKRIPRFSDAVVWRGDRVLLRNGSSGKAHVYDLGSGRQRRFVVGEVAGRLLHERPDGSVIAAGVLDGEGVVWGLASLTARPRRLATVAAMQSMAVEDAGAVWITPGLPFEHTLSTALRGQGTKHLLRYAGLAERPERVTAPRKVEVVDCGRGELWAVGEQRHVDAEAVVERLRLADGEWLEPLRAPARHWIAAIDPRAAVAFSRRWDGGDSCTVACLAPDG